MNPSRFLITGICTACLCLLPVSVSAQGMPDQNESSDPIHLNDDLYSDEIFNDEIYAALYQNEIPEAGIVGNSSKLQQEMKTALAPYQENDWGTEGSIGFFLSIGESEAAAIVAKGVLDGIVKLDDPKDCASMTHLRASLDYIDTCNQLRKNHGRQPLQVNASLMAAAIVQADASADVIAHSRLYNVGENLAWGYIPGNAMGNNNPFDAWYTQEKKLYDLNPSDQAAAGHFLNIIDPDYRLTGFAMGTNSSLFYEGSVFSQTFACSSAGYSGMSTAQFRKKIDTFNASKTNGTLEPKFLNGHPMYRLYNRTSGEHFYTKNREERNYLIRAGWLYEGFGWVAPDGGTPVYRLYNPNAGDHHYTTDTQEKAGLIKAGWKDEGIGWHTDAGNGRALHRQYNPNAKSGSHNFTVSVSEKNFLISSGWKDEGIAWYGVVPKLK